MKRAYWAPLLVVACLVTALTVLLERSGNPDQALRVPLADALQRYTLFDAELTRDVLLARAGLLSNYDPLAEDRRNLVHAYDVLRRRVADGSPETRAALSGALDNLARAHADKLVAVEHFKSKNALLQNSLRYLAFAAPILHIPDRDGSIAPEMGHLSYAVLRFMQVPDPGVAEEIQGVLDRLAAMRGRPGELPTLVSHGRLIVTLVPQTNAMLREIVQGTVAVRAAEIDTAFLMHTRAADDRARIYRQLMYAVAVLLVAYIATQFVRLRRAMVDRARSAAALRVSEARLRAISDSAREAIVSVDSAGRIVAWNAGGTAMFGHAPHEAIGQPISMLWQTAERPVQERAIADFLAHPVAGPATRELAGMRKDGTPLPLEVSLSAWASAEGRFATAIMRDVSERRRLEDHAREQELQLIQANRMAVLGRLIASVTHEISNPTQAILHNARFLSAACAGLFDHLRPSPAGDPAAVVAGHTLDELRRELPGKADDIHDAGTRIRRYVDDLRNFHLPRKAAAAGAFDVNAAVQRALRLLRPQINERTRRFSVQLDPTLACARGDAQRFEQVVVNLVANALESLPSAQSAVAVATRHDAAGNVVLTVEDQGVGIVRQDLARICEPFFTTRQSVGGSGLGLAITASLLKDMHGALHFESEPGQGTRAFVLLRAATLAAPAEVAQSLTQSVAQSVAQPAAQSGAKADRA